MAVDFAHIYARVIMPTWATCSSDDDFLLVGSVKARGEQQLFSRANLAHARAFYSQRVEARRDLCGFPLFERILQFVLLRLKARHHLRHLKKVRA